MKDVLLIGILIKLISN